VYTPTHQNIENLEVLQLGEDLTACNEAKEWPLGEIRAKVSVSFMCKYVYIYTKEIALLHVVLPYTPPYVVYSSVLLTWLNCVYS
jgi:hypothetical protein